MVVYTGHPIYSRKCKIGELQCREAQAKNETLISKITRVK
jgi:hypothetical protein